MSVSRVARLSVVGLIATSLLCTGETRGQSLSAVLIGEQP